MNKREKLATHKTAVDCAQAMLDKLGGDTEFLILVNSKTTHCSVCTDPMAVARSLMIGIADESSPNRHVLYSILKAAAASLLLCKDIDFHKDFEDCMSDCLMDSLCQ